MLTKFRNDKFNNKVIWITGASSGIGYALAKELYQRGAKLALSGRNEKALHELADILSKDRVLVYPFDVTDKAANAAAVTAIVNHFGQLDIVILNAGISQHSSLNHLIESMENTIKVNLLGVTYGVEPVVRYFRQQKKGHLAVICSLAGFGGVPHAEAYSASKAAVRSLFQGLTVQLKRQGIAVSTICPGFIKTPLTDKNTYSMPFLMLPEKAAKIIADGLEKQKTLICFPFIFSGLVRFLNVLPNSLYLKLVGLHKRT